MRPVEYLEELGWLGDDVWLAHCVHLDEREIARFGETRHRRRALPVVERAAGRGDRAGRAAGARGRAGRPRRRRRGLQRGGRAGRRAAPGAAARAAARRAGGASPRARRSSWARSTARAASAATTSSARWRSASSPTSCCGGSTTSTTPASTTRSPRSCSAPRPLRGHGDRRRRGRRRRTASCRPATWQSRSPRRARRDGGRTSDEHDHDGPRRRRRVRPRAPTASRRSRASSPTRRTCGPRACCGARRCARPHPRARIRSIEIGAALAVPGVRAVLTHEDVPGRKTYGLEHHDQPVLAFAEVRYQGEPVAIVAADHPETARRAADRIEVDYEVLEPLVDPEFALRPDSPPLHPARQPAAPRAHRARRGARRGRRRGDRRVRGRDAGPGLPRAGVRARDPGRGRRRRPVHLDPVAARGPRPGRRVASTCRRTRCASRSRASAARSAGARTSRCRSTRACSRCTPAGR